MRQLLLAIILILGSAVAFTLWALEDPGYVVIGRGPWTLETTLSLLIWILAVGGILLYAVLKSVYYLWQLPTSFLTKRAQQKQQKAFIAIEDGLNALSCGHWREAEQLFAKHLTTHLAHYVGAAYAAQQQSHPERAIMYLEQAQENGLDAKLALVLLQTKLHLQQHNLVSAHKNALYAKIIASDKQEVLWLLLVIHLQAANWVAIAELLPILRKQKLLSTAQVQALQKRIENITGKIRGD